MIIIENTELQYAHCLTRSILFAIRASPKDSQIIQLSQELVFPQLMLQSIKAVLGSSDAWCLDKDLINLWGNNINDVCVSWVYYCCFFTIH